MRPTYIIPYQAQITSFPIQALLSIVLSKLGSWAQSSGCPYCFNRVIIYHLKSCIYCSKICALVLWVALKICASCGAAGNHVYLKGCTVVLISEGKYLSITIFYLHGSLCLLALIRWKLFSTVCAIVGEKDRPSLGLRPSIIYIWMFIIHFFLH